MKRRVSDLIGALTLFGAILPALPADADAISTYTGFPMEAIIGSAVAGQGFLFSFITPTLLPAHLTLDPNNEFVVVPVISWTADAGPYSVSSSSPNSPTLFDLHFQTDSAGLITGWHISLGSSVTATAPSLAMGTVAPLIIDPSNPFDINAFGTIGVSGAYAGDFVQANPFPRTVSDLAVSITPGQWSLCMNGSCSLASDPSLSVPSPVTVTPIPLCPLLWPVPACPV
jgi:hypothetical protein